MKKLITGSSGTIGTRLCQRIPKDFIGIDKVGNKWDKEIQDRTILHDLRWGLKLDEDIDIAILLAANARVNNLVIDPVLARDNFEITFNTMEYCRKEDIDRVIFASSREVYGNTDRIIHNEDESYIKNCESPYTATKIGCEALIHSYQQCYGINFIIIRYSNVYGMYDDSDRVVPLFIEKARKNEDIEIYGGNKILDFTFIDDAIDGTLRCINKFDNVENNVFNIASGVGNSIMDVANTIIEFTGSDSKILMRDNRTGEVCRYVADISKAKSILGYEPKYTLRHGLSRTL